MRPLPAHTEVWAYDFIFDRCTNGGLLLGLLVFCGALLPTIGATALPLLRSADGRARGSGSSPA